jgi:[ribosomal protein S5]-alanine N-acetyltransferase
MAAIHTDPRTNQHRPGGAPPLQQAIEMAHEFLDVWEREGYGYWAVEQDGTLVGVAGVKALAFRGRQSWNLYYRFSPKHWEKGLAAEAVREALNAAKAPSRPIVARTRPTTMRPNGSLKGSA